MVRGLEEARERSTVKSRLPVKKCDVKVIVVAAGQKYGWAPLLKYRIYLALQSSFWMKVWVHGLKFTNATSTTRKATRTTSQKSTSSGLNCDRSPTRGVDACESWPAGASVGV